MKSKLFKKRSESSKVYEYSEKSDENTVSKTYIPKKTAILTIRSNSINLGSIISTYDTTSYIADSYTLVPLRAIGDVFGAEISWDQFTKTASIVSGENTALFTIDSNTMKYNNVVKEIPKSAEITNNRTYVPLRAIGETLGAEVNWVDSTKTIFITK